MAVGELVVKLGLDAAEYTRGLTKAEVDARRFGEAIGENIRTAALASSAALVALGGAAIAANAAFNKLLDGAAKFQDLAEETGASATSIAGLSVAAATAGVTIESVAGSMNKLTKNLVGVDDESKTAGAALAALGINVADFKKLDPAAQYLAVGTALDKFADGAGKSAVAMGLWGKAGAEQLKVAKAVVEQGGATNILTEEQIALADAYRDAQAKATAELTLYASALATQAVPAITAFTGVLKDAIAEAYNLGTAANALSGSNGFAVFAEDVGRQLAKVIDYIATTKQEIAVLGDFASSSFSVIGNLLSGNLQGARQAGAEFRARNGLDENGFGDSGRKAAQSYVQKFNAGLASAKRSAFAATDPRRVDLVGGQPAGKPALNFGGATKAAGAGKKDNSAAQEAKAQLSSDLDAIKNAQEAVTNTYANQEKILEALRSAGLKDETAYYQEKQRLLAQTATAQEDALQKQIARLQQEQLSGKDAIDTAKKIADTEAKLAKIREDSATQAQVLGIQQAAAYSRIKEAILSAQQAAQDFFDTTNRGYAREIAGIGKGNKARSFDSGITQIEDKYRQQRQDLQNQRAQAELAGTFTPDKQKQFDAQLDIINSFQSKAIDSYKSYYSTLDTAQKDWVNGATEALKNYADESANVAKQMEDTIGNAFKGLEDQLVDFVTTGKFNFKSLADSILKDVARMAIKQGITGPLAGLLGGALGGGGKDEIGDLLKSSGLASGGSSGGGWLSSLISLFGKAGGGNVNPGQMVRVNENGPELLDYRGKQYLMNGSSNVQITPNHRIGDGGGFSQINNFPMQGRIDYDTQSQIANKVRRQTNTAAARFN